MWPAVSRDSLCLWLISYQGTNFLRIEQFLISDHFLLHGFTPTRYCSVDTELICWVNGAHYWLNVSWVRCEVNNVSSWFSFQCSSVQRTCTSECGMTTLLALLNQLIGSHLPSEILSFPGPKKVLAEIFLRNLSLLWNSKYGAVNVLSFSNQCHWTLTWIGFFPRTVVDLFVEFSGLSGLVWESHSMWMLGKYSTQTRLLLHRSHITLICVGFLEVLKLIFVHSIVETFSISNARSQINLWVMSNNVLSSSKLVFLYATNFFEWMVRIINWMFSESAAKWIVFRPCLRFNVPQLSVPMPRNTGWPLCANTSIIRSACWSHFPSGL